MNVDDNYLPEEYVAQYFFQHVGLPKYKRNSKTYEGCCPFCREGKSWGKKKRFYYIVEDDKVVCHNCRYSNRSLYFIKDVSGLTFEQIKKESQEYDIIPVDPTKDEYLQTKKYIPSLPKNSVNLFDEAQVNFYKEEITFKLALAEIKRRRLDTAVNRVNKIYFSFDDFTHKNRLILPYYDENKVLKFYQSRRLISDDTPTYLGKTDDKILPNLCNIDYDNPYIFMFEGYIDSMFVKNSTCCSGIVEGNMLYTPKQRQQLSKFPFQEVIWVLDNQWLDKTALQKTKDLIEIGERVFIWPEKYKSHFKDFNELCVRLGIDEIHSEFIIKNAPDNKLEALVKLGSFS